MSGALAQLLTQIGVAAKSVLGVNCLETCLALAAHKPARIVCILPDGELAVASSKIGQARIEIWPMSGGWPEPHGFDIVICRDRPAHARHPFAMMHAMADIAREALLLDLPAMGWRAPRMGLPPGVTMAASLFPSILVSRNGSTGKSHAPKFLFSKRSLAHLLLRHRGDMANLAFSRKDGRLACLAQKRRIGHLILVSGPVSAGKSVFIEGLRAGRWPAVAKTLGLEPGQNTIVLGTSAKAERGPPQIAVALAHYGFLRTYMRPATVPLRDEALDLVKVADRVSIITLVVSPEELQRRITQGEIDVAANGRASARHLRLREEYGDAGRLQEHYERWFAVAEKLADAHYIVKHETQSPVLEPFRRWRKRNPAHRNNARTWVSGDGDATENDSAKLAALLPPTVAGLSLLVVGSGSGQFCREARLRGARHIVGLERNADLLMLAQANGGADFRHGGLEVLRQGERFDAVICLEDVGQERDPLAFIDALAARTRGFIAFACSPKGMRLDARAVGLGFLRNALAMFPAVFSFRNGAANNRHDPKFLLTRTALNRALLLQRRLFSEVRFHKPAPFGQSFAIARRFTIPHVIVVAGPVSSGKSTLCRRLLAGEVDFIYDTLGVVSAQRPSYVYLPRARSSKPPEGPVVLFHYNILNAYLSTAHVHENDENLDILHCADKVSVLTVWANPETLVRQITKSEIEGGLFHRPSKRHLMLREEYQDAARVRYHYNCWLSFVARLGHQSFVVTTQGEKTSLLTPEQWRAGQGPDQPGF